MIDIKPSQRNTNKHTKDGMDLLENSINKVGVIESISVASDGTIISGHARFEHFEKQGKKPIEIHLKENEYPVIVTDIENNSKEYFEAQILANTTANKNFDLDIEMIEVIAEEFDIDIEEIGVEVEENIEDLKEKKGEKDENEDFFIPDCIYNSNNMYDIPTLKIERQANELHLPLKPYGAEKRTNGGVGTYHFYVDDYRFEAIWKNPINILKSGCTQIVEPNLSLFDTTPIGYGIFLIYKKRWISRFLQEKGYNVYADLNVSQKFHEYNVLGIPDGYNSFFTRGYTGRLKALEVELEIAKKISGKAEPNLVVYGGSKEIKEFCFKNNLTFVKDFINDK